MDGYYQIDFLLPTNQDWADSFTIQAGDPLAPVNLTGHTFQMHIRHHVEDLATVMILTSGNGRIGISGSPANGTVAIYVPDDEIKHLEPGEYAHDILMFDAAGNPRRIAVGTVVVERGVTRI